MSGLLGSLVAQIGGTSRKVRTRPPRPHGIPSAKYQARQAAAAAPVRPSRFEEMVALLNADGRRMPTAQHRARRDERAAELAEVLEYLRHGERTATVIAAHIGKSYSVLRNDIAILRNAGLIASRPTGEEGAVRFWFLSDPAPIIPDK